MRPKEKGVKSEKGVRVKLKEKGVRVKLIIPPCGLVRYIDATDA
jgi:hypothetical protein